MRTLVRPGIFLLMALAASLLWPTPGPTGAAGPDAGMSMQIRNDCDDPGELASVQRGVPFVVCVVSNPAPDVEISGFASEVVFPEELKWLQRPSCTDEVQVKRQDAGVLAVCESFVTALGGVGHVVHTEFGSPPLEPLTVTPGSTTTLLELDFTCNGEGGYKLTLTAVPDSDVGALYADLNANEIFLKTVPQDYDDDTIPNDVADTLTIDCERFVGGIAELPEVAGTPLATDSSSRANVGIAMAIAAGAVALGGVAWYGRRRLRR